MLRSIIPSQSPKHTATAPDLWTLSSAWESVRTGSIHTDQTESDTKWEK